MLGVDCEEGGYLKGLRKLSEEVGLRLEASRFTIQNGIHAGGDVLRMGFNAHLEATGEMPAKRVFMAQLVPAQGNNRTSSDRTTADEIYAYAFPEMWAGLSPSERGGMLG